MTAAKWSSSSPKGDDQSGPPSQCAKSKSREPNTKEPSAANGATSGLEQDELTAWQRQRAARLSAGGVSLPRTSLASSGGLNGGRDLTVCDITGDWGLYQWSLCMFAAVYSALSSIVVVFGPMYTPDMAHVCLTGSQMAPTSGNSSARVPLGMRPDLIPADRHECFMSADVPAVADIEEGLIVDETEQPIAVKCANFLYNDFGHGLMLTNGFDLVCDRRWLRSLVYSSALAGMLISSVTLGLFSDMFGRLRCVQVGFAISCLANVVAILMQDYFLFCACIALMSFAQMGAANALCTLLMEATSPRFRYVPVFQFGAGWAAGMMLLPLLNELTHNFRLLMTVLLAWQLLMLPWLHWGVFESIRWLLSEGHLNRAQIELRRACRMNRVETNTELAQSIARMEAQQVRKASRIIEHELAPKRLSRALGVKVDESAREIDVLSSAIRRSLFGEISDGDRARLDNLAAAANNEPTSRSGSISARSSIGGLEMRVTGGGDQQHQHQHQHKRQVAHHHQSSNQQQLDALSPTLSRMSFSITAPVIVVTSKDDYNDQEKAVGDTGGSPVEGPLSDGANQRLPSVGHISFAGVNDHQHMMMMPDQRRKGSLTTQGLIQLAMKYSKTIERQESGQCFVVQMFHRKLWRPSTVLLMVSIMLETAYYGLLQTNTMVGSSVYVNYITGALGDFTACLFSCFLLAFTSRSCSLISSTLLSSVVCLAMALSYHLIPDVPQSSGYTEHLRQQASALSNHTTTTTTTTTVAPLMTTPTGPLDGGANLSLALRSASLLLGDDSIMGAKNLAVAALAAAAASASSGGNATTTSGLAAAFTHDELIDIRQTISFYLMIAGKFLVSLGIAVAATIALEAYPNNLRQTGLGVIVCAGRLGSILAPFLFNDPSPDKHVFKMTLVCLGVLGILVCCFVPVTIRDQKGKDLCDQLNEIE